MGKAKSFAAKLAHETSSEGKVICPVCNTELKKLLGLPRNEKIKIVHTLWDNIAKDSAQGNTYPEHIEIIKKR